MKIKIYLLESGAALIPYRHRNIKQSLALGFEGLRLAIAGYRLRLNNQQCLASDKKAVYPSTL
jgi:hypothetical protein